MSLTDVNILTSHPEQQADLELDPRSFDSKALVLICFCLQAVLESHPVQHVFPDDN